MLEFKEEISTAVEKALNGKLKRNEIVNLMEVPPSPELGDFAFPCFKLSALMKKAPNVIAVELSKKIVLPECVEKTEPAGPYINFFITKQFIASQAIKKVLSQKEEFGRSSLGNGQKVMVEYSAPNTNKPLHLGHLRNNFLGMSVARILQANGFEVVKANLVNDRGIHICKSMLAYKLFGKGKTPESENKKSDHFVGDYYVMYNQKVKENSDLEKQAYDMLQKWEKGDKETIALWEKMTKWAVDGFKQTYKKFGTKFDTWFFESKFYDKAKPVLELGKEKGLFKENDEGALMAQLEEHGMPNKTVLRADGTSIYITNDLALTKHKFEHFKLNEAFWVVASEQDLYFKQLFKIFELVGFPWAKNCKHLSYGMVNLPSGKMKSREGTVVDADDLLAELEGLAREKIKKRDEKIGKKELGERSMAIALAAIKFHLLKVAAKKDLLFNPKESVSFEGETGPYIQYTHARAKSILRKAKDAAKPTGFKNLSSAEEQKLAKLLASFPSIVEKSLQQMSPHIICQFLIETAEAFNTFYHKHRVIQASDKVRSERLALVKATAQVLKNGLSLLDIEAIEEM